MIERCGCVRVDVRIYMCIMCVHTDTHTHSMFLDLDFLLLALEECSFGRVRHVEIQTCPVLGICTDGGG